MNDLAPSAAAIYSSLAPLGLTRAQAKRLLPEWWSSESERGPSGVAELALLLARRLSLDVAALMEGRISPRGSAVDIAYKHQSENNKRNLLAATHIASATATAVIAASHIKYAPLSSDPLRLHQQIKATGDGVVAFHALLDFCWRAGLPVIPLPNLPVGVRKMDGAALLIGNRPAIVISKKRSSRAWLSFILAHEIGHIALGHLKQGSSIIDVSLKEEATYASESSSDTQERDADAYALSLLGGERISQHIGGWSHWLSPVELAVQSREVGELLGIEPGHVILRYAFATKRWSESSSALRFLSEDMNAETVLAQSLSKHLDLNKVSDDIRDLIEKVTGIC